MCETVWHHRLAYLENIFYKVAFNLSLQGTIITVVTVYEKVEFFVYKIDFGLLRVDKNVTDWIESQISDLVSDSGTCKFWTSEGRVLRHFKCNGTISIFIYFSL